MKYFVWSFDDGLEEDKQIIRILRKNHMGATFNLNSALFGKRQMIGRIGNLGIKEVPLERFDERRASLLKYSIHYRIPKDEIADVYEGFEIASHTAEHVSLVGCSDAECQRQVRSDQEILGGMFHTKISGFAYPFGRYRETTKRQLEQCGIVYARTASFTKEFSLPQDLLELPLNGWHIRKDALARVREFAEAESERDLFFLMFAHGYEFDFQTKESNFEKFKRICDLVAGREDIVCCSTGEAIRAIREGKHES